jgi:hypothetical protein
MAEKSVYDASDIPGTDERSDFNYACIYSEVCDIYALISVSNLALISGNSN